MLDLGLALTSSLQEITSSSRSLAGFLALLHCFLERAKVTVSAPSPSRPLSRCLHVFSQHGC
jgi:hypothetical protein